jgi:DNA-binding CsgD family transcriptional regulator
MNTWELARCRDVVERLAAAPLAPEILGRELVAGIRRAIPFLGWCFAVADPETLLVASAVAENPAIRNPGRLFELEYAEDVNRYRDLVERRTPVRSLHAATGGDLRRSARWREIYDGSGLADELRIVLVLDGRCWGFLELLREPGDGVFSEEEGTFLARLMPQIATSLKRSLMADLPHAQRGERRTAPGPGTVILDQDFREIAATPEAEEWMSRIRSTSDGKFTPTAVLAVAARVRSLRGARPLPGEEPRVRVRGPSGEWVTIVAAPLIGESALSGAIAVTLAGSGAEAGTLLLEAHGLTARERELAALVLEGFSNREIAERLFLSPYTVGDHLKAILEKIGAHSKRELIASALGGVVGEGFRTASFPPTGGSV